MMAVAFLSVDQNAKRLSRTARARRSCAYRLAILERGDQPVLDLGQGAAADVGMENRKPSPPDLLHTSPMRAATASGVPTSSTDRSTALKLAMVSADGTAFAHLAELLEVQLMAVGSSRVGQGLVEIELGEVDVRHLPKMRQPLVDVPMQGRPACACAPGLFHGPRPGSD